MPRNLLLTLEYPPERGGIARYLEAIVHAFPECIHVIAKKSELLGAWWPRWGESVQLLWKKRATYDQVLISHLLPLGTAAWIARFATRKPYIILTHGMDIGLAKRDGWKQFLAKRILCSARLVVANSFALEQELRQDFGLTHTCVVYPPVMPLPDKPICPENFHLVDFLTVGRLVSRKGHERVLQALALLRDRDHQTFTYRIIGSGPHRETIEQCIHDLKLNNHVQLMMDVDDTMLACAYQQCRVFVMPAHHTLEDREGFGMVYLEAALYGIPSIATQQSGVDEAVIDQETGWLISDGDIEAIAATMQHAITHTDERNTMGEAARKRAREQFSPEVALAPLRSYLL